MRVLVTGSSGFIGSHLCSYLRFCGHTVYPVSRDPLSPYYVPDINPFTDWSSLLRGVDVVVHCAARVHRKVHSRKDEIEVFRDSNLRSTVRLASQSIDAGVQRFVFISTIKVHGECSSVSHPFTCLSPFNPVGPYAISKYEAELELQALFSSSSSKVVVIRPCLTIGPGVKSNINTLVRLIRLGVPMPFSLIENSRSFCPILTLCQIIESTVSKELNGNPVFLAASQQYMSTKLLVSTIANAVEANPIFLPVPKTLLMAILTLSFQKETFDKLCGSLVVDPLHTFQTLNIVETQSVVDSILDSCSHIINKRCL